LRLERGRLSGVEFPNGDDDGRMVPTLNENGRFLSRKCDVEEEDTHCEIFREASYSFTLSFFLSIKSLGVELISKA
jgi:hypothetical protein